MSVMLSAAGSLRWFRDALARASITRRWPMRPAEVPAGSDGLVFLPYLSGERSPHPDPLARGAFVGLTLAHDRRHLTRAVMEGVAYGLRDGLELMVGAGMPRASRMLGSGGDSRVPRGARSWPMSSRPRSRSPAPRRARHTERPYWRQLVAAGMRRWTRRAPHWSPPRQSPHPGRDGAAYADRYAIYRSLYPTLAEVPRRGGEPGSTN